MLPWGMKPSPDNSRQKMRRLHGSNYGKSLLLMLSLTAATCRACLHSKFSAASRPSTTTCTAPKLYKKCILERSVVNYMYNIHLNDLLPTSLRSSVGQSEGLLIPRSSVRARSQARHLWNYIFFDNTRSSTHLQRCHQS